MINFKTFITEKADPRVKVLVDLDKAKDKLEALVQRNTGSNSKSAWKAQDKYNSLIDKAQELGIWDTFCKHYKLHPKHDARDYWA